MLWSSPRQASSSFLLLDQPTTPKFHTYSFLPDLNTALLTLFPLSSQWKKKTPGMSSGFSSLLHPQVCLLFDVLFPSLYPKRLLLFGSVKSFASEPAILLDASPPVFFFLTKFYLFCSLPRWSFLFRSPPGLLPPALQIVSPKK